jgi:hypothetical protein
MNDIVQVLPEPELEFLHGQKLQDPHDGLGLFGPFSADQPSHPKNIVYAIIGPKEGIRSHGLWSNAISHPILSEEGLDARLWPHFPGFDAAFLSDWSTKPAFAFEIDRQELSIASRDLDPFKRAYQVVNAYIEGIKVARRRDEAFGVIICIVPDEVWKNCRPESTVLDGVGLRLSRGEKKQRIKGQAHLFEYFDPNQYALSVDFRRQLKARAMEYEIPLQIIRESTLRLGPPTEDAPRGLTPLSDRAWNLSTTLFYKAGGKPWRLSGAREGVCYVGIAFRKINPDEGNRSACCAAQMFLDSGDGIVFTGENGPWYSPERGQFHLSRVAAKNLLEGVLKTYRQFYGKELGEVFLHCRSDISPEEYKGYREACPKGVKIVGVRVRLERGGLRLYRHGSMPVIRGTFLEVSDRTGFLWASGFKPRLATYDGWEVPTPLRIDIQHGAASIQQVAKDIFGLTKLNYNACNLGDSEPVTVLFSNAVGEILVANPTVARRLPQFKFYI